MKSNKLLAIAAAVALMPSTTFLTSEAISTSFAGNTPDQNVNISATVPANCNFSQAPSSSVTVSTYDTTSATATSATGTFALRCTKGTAVKVTMGLGTHAVSTQRKLLIEGGGSDTLNYEIRQDSSTGTLWGPTAGTNSYDYTASSNAPASKTFAVVIPAGQDVPTGTYSDTVIVVANYT